MSLSDYLYRLVSRWRVVLATIIVFVGVTIGVTLTIQPTYVSTARIYVANSDPGADVGTAMASAVYAQQKVLSYAAVASSDRMARVVIDDLGLDLTPAELAGEVTTTVEFGTVLVTLKVSDHDARQARGIAASILDNYNDVLNELEKTDEESAPISVSVLEAPSTPTSPDSPKPMLNILASLFAGLLMGLGLAALRDVLDNTVKTRDDLTRLGVSPLGEIPKTERKRNDTSPPIIASGDHSPLGEAFRQVRVNLRFASLDSEPRMLMVSSYAPNEGKSFVSSNLASVYAATGMRVLLVDLDLRRPVQASRFGLEGSVGITNVLLGRVPLEDALQPVKGTGITLLASGVMPPNPAEVLSAQAMHQLLESLPNRFDVVIMDTPPVGPFADARQLGHIADGVVLVSEASSTKNKDLRGAADALAEVGANVLGVVINRSKQVVNNHYYRYYDVRSEAKRRRTRRRTPKE